MRQIPLKSKLVFRNGRWPVDKVTGQHVTVGRMAGHGKKRTGWLLNKTVSKKFAWLSDDSAMGGW